MKKKIVSIIINNERLDLFEKNKNFYFKNFFLSKKYQTFLVDISNLHLFKKNKNYNISGEKFIYYRPRNFSELKNFFNKYTVISFIKIKYNISNLRLHILLKKINIKKTIMLANYGFFPLDNDRKKINFYQRIKFFFSIKLNYFFYRLLVFLRIIRGYDIFVTSSNKFINTINSSISSKLDNKFSFLKISFYKKIYRVNTLFYNNYLKSKKKYESTNEKIIFCDSGFDHGDRINREGSINSEIREKYYYNLNNFLNDIQKNLSKRVIFCQHPKSDYPASNEFDNIKKKFEFLKYDTEKNIYSSYLTIFQSSLLINYAILLKKKIILITSDYLGNFYHRRFINYKKEIDLVSFNIDNYVIDNSDQSLIKLLDQKILNYDNYQNENLFTDKNMETSNQVENLLDKEFND